MARNLRVYATEIKSAATFGPMPPEAFVRFLLEQPHQDAYNVEIVDGDGPTLVGGIVVAPPGKPPFTSEGECAACGYLDSYESDGYMHQGYIG
jgi:hypothetical protein